MYAYTRPEDRKAQDVEFKAQIYSQMATPKVLKIVDDENGKLKDQLLEHQANHIVKELQKLYDEKYQYISDIQGI